MRAAEVHARAIVHHGVIAVASDRPLQVIDITLQVAAVVQRAGLREGTAAIVTRHTTTGLLLNEYEPLLAADLAAMFERLVPAAAAYAHDDFTRRIGLQPGERINGHAHCRAALLRASEIVPVAGGALALGRWQRVLFVDCDGGQRREVAVVCQGLGADDVPSL
jgi:secondary thiamine-phosphate synthase enzyme